MMRVLLGALVLLSACGKPDRDVESPPPPTGEMPAPPLDQPENPAPPENVPIDPSSEPNQLPPGPKPSTEPNTSMRDLRSPLLAGVSQPSELAGGRAGGPGTPGHPGSGGTSGAGGTAGTGATAGTGSGGRAGSAGTAIR
jgi:hypothetical protein